MADLVNQWADLTEETNDDFFVVSGRKLKWLATGVDPLQLATHAVNLLLPTKAETGVAGRITALRSAAKAYAIALRQNKGSEELDALKQAVYQKLGESGIEPPPELSQTQRNGGTMAGASGFNQSDNPDQYGRRGQSRQCYFVVLYIHSMPCSIVISTLYYQKFRS
jgi:hypothetical protein